MRIAVFCDVYPELSETFVVNELRALRRLGHEVRVVAGERAARPEWPEDLDAEVCFLPDPSRAGKLRALAALHPARAARDLADRRAWRREERPRRLGALAPAVRWLEGWADHLHAHFAAGAALDALRAGALLDLPVSVTAHAYDIFASPRTLAAKLGRATFATSGCDYNVRHLRGLLAPEHAGKVHEIVMGVDGDAFRRERPAPGPSGRVLAVGRLVEKKGFGDLIEAAALVRAAGGPLERVTIVGDGPLAQELGARVAAHELQDVVELPGTLPPAAVRDALEETTVLAMPCVVAADGDRDSMPVVVKEALAMEVPVVATDEVGLPELVRPEFGRLVPPGDPPALAAALREVLSLPALELEAMGRAGRQHVLEHCDVDRETARLADLMAAAVAERRAR